MIGLVIVSHSAALAKGVVELAAQMAPEVTIAAAGGTEDGEIGTSLELVTAAIAEADTGDGAVILTDLGSATMTAETALEFLDDEQRDRVLLVDAPLVEGAIAAATEAAGGASVGAVREAAMAAGGGVAPSPEPAAAPAAGEPVAERTSTLPNRLGLHARPASQLVGALRPYDADVVLERVDTGARASGRSLLGIVGLAAVGGVTVRLTATGPDAEAALAEAAALMDAGFGEDGDGGAGDAADTAAAEAAPRAGAGLPPPAGEPEPGELRGVPGAPGIAVGPAALPKIAALPVPDAPSGTAEQERRRLDDARAVAAAALARDGTEGIFAAHRDVLEDPELTAAAEEGIAAGRGAARAWADAVEEWRARLAALDDPVFAQRAADVEDVGRRVLAALAGVSAEPSVPAGSIAVAEDVVPSAVPALAEAGAVAIALAAGGPGSHAAVLARSLGLPLVVGLGDGLRAMNAGTVLVVDGDRGTVVADPDEPARKAAAERAQRALDERAAGRAAAARPVRTIDGTPVRVGANVASVAEARRAVEEGADEVGLLRTELLFLDRPTLPTEDEQVEALAAILEVMGDRPVVVRTLDVGGDKVAPALDLDPVRNGFLGTRGLRWSLAQPAPFATQLRAILRAARGHQVRIMFPMVTTPAEVRAARAALNGARAALEAEGVAHGDIGQVGIMVEVPAAAVAPDLLAAEVDFLSIGSNDLLSYVMAADRTVAEVAGLRDPWSPAFLRLVAGVCDAAAAAGAWVGVCGDTAADPDYAAVLAGLGVTELSMAPPAIGAVKARLRETDLGKARREALRAAEGAR